MVHRAPDSRLLTSLSAHEQAYHKHLLQRVDGYAQSALNALAAYASATPAGTARGIMGVVGSLAGADEALRRYAYAVDEWRMKLEGIRQAEEDVARDRLVRTGRGEAVGPWQVNEFDRGAGGQGSAPDVPPTATPLSEIAAAAGPAPPVT